MSKPWGGGGIGSWAAEAELAEAEELATAAATPAAANPQSFPSLREAVAAKSKRKTMTLSEFYGSSSGSSTTRLTHDELLQLPTAPKQRTPDEVGTRLGGGFSNYGDDRRGGPPPAHRGFDDDRRGPPRRGPDFEVQPSRADEVDNWASVKRSIPQTAPVSDTGRGSRYGSLGGGSRADEVKDWNFGKKLADPPPPGRSSSYGSGYRSSGGSDSWRRGDSRESEMGRPRLVLDPPKGGGSNENVGQVMVNTNKPNPFGAARPREEVLAEKGLDWKKLDLEIEAKKPVTSSSSRPTSSQGSRPTSSQSNRSESVGGSEAMVKPRPKVSPFGDAKPREVLLQEKGVDWRKLDLELEHRGIDRPETEEEKALKEEIEKLRKEIEKKPASDVRQDSGDEQSSIRDLLQSKERDLEALVRELNDKVRFGQKAVERPGSGAGRFTNFPERPPSQSGSYEDGRAAESTDRPRSRGTADVWTRPGEDRRGGFQGGRDRGFLSNRDFGRSRSRERW